MNSVEHRNDIVPRTIRAIERNLAGLSSSLSSMEQSFDDSSTPTSSESLFEGSPASSVNSLDHHHDYVPRTIRAIEHSLAGLSSSLSPMEQSFDDTSRPMSPKPFCPYTDLLPTFSSMKTDLEDLLSAWKVEKALMARFPEDVPETLRAFKSRVDELTARREVEVQDRTVSSLSSRGVCNGLPSRGDPVSLTIKNRRFKNFGKMENIVCCRKSSPYEKNFVDRRQVSHHHILPKNVHCWT